MVVDDLDTICRYICRIYSSLDIFFLPFARDDVTYTCTLVSEKDYPMSVRKIYSHYKIKFYCLYCNL